MFRLFLLCASFVPAVLSQDAEIYPDRPAKTVLGCTCKSSCTTSFLFECDAALFCEVEDHECAFGTAGWSVSHGYYDYCAFDEYWPYEKQTAAGKQAIVLDRVGRDHASGSYPLPTPMGIMTESVMFTFDTQADMFPQPRRKYIHSRGVVGGVSFHSLSNHAYSGVFKGAEYGLIRLSSAKLPGLPAVPGIMPAYTPGAAFKFFRDGRPSANFVAMPSLDGQWCTETNFFEHDFSNHVANTGDFALKLIADKFWQASYCPLMVGLSDLASEDNQTARFPWQLVLHPLVKVDCPCLDYGKCLANLGELKPGTQLFEVRAISQPGSAPEPIGHVVLSSQLVPSKFGDEQLFFRHQHMEEDFNAHPDWLEKIDRTSQCGMGCAGTSAPPISKGCRSPFKTNEFLSKKSMDMRQDDAISVV